MRTQLLLTLLIAMFGVAACTTDGGSDGTAADFTTNLLGGSSSQAEAGGADTTRGDGDGASSSSADSDADAEPGDTTCGNIVPLDLNAVEATNEKYVLVEMTGTEDQFQGSCTDSRAMGSEAVISFVVPSAGEWEFNTRNSEFDTVLYIRSSCLDLNSEIAPGCNDDIDYAAGLDKSRLRMELEEGQQIYIVVDAYNGLSPSQFTLTAKPYVPTDPPTLNAVQMAIDIERATIAIKVEGNDPESDTTAAFLELLNETGMGVYGPDGAGSSSPLNKVEHDDDGNFTGLWYRRFTGSDLTIIDSARVRAVDEEGQRSNALEVLQAELITPESATRGEACDNVSAVCDITSVCLDGTCSDPAAVSACPDDWNATILEPDAQGRVTIQADNTSAVGLAVGDCGGGGATQVYVYTAPIAGTFFALMDGEDSTNADGEVVRGDPLMFARRLCDYAELGPIGDGLACNDDRGRNDAGEVVQVDANGQPLLGAAIKLELAAEETVYLFADSFTQDGQVGWRGAYTLKVEPAVPPTLDTVNAYLNADEPSIGLEITGVDTDVNAVDVTLLDADGEELNFGPTAGDAEDVAGAANGGNNPDDDDENLRSDDNQLDADAADDAAEDAPENPNTRRFRLRLVEPGENGTYTGSVSFLLPDEVDVSRLAQIKVVAVDAAEFTSDAVTTSLTAPPGVESGTVCDIFGGLNRCTVEGEECYLVTEQATQPTCAPASAPVVTSAEFFAGATNGEPGFTFVVAGSDADKDIVGFRMRFLDHCGDDLLDGGGEVIFEFTQLDYEGNSTGTFDARAQYRFTEEFPFADLRSVEVAVVDRARLDSGTDALGFAQPGLLSEGQACSPADLTKTCASGSVCASDGTPVGNAAETFSCRSAQRACDPLWPVIELNLHPTDAGNTWSYQGDTTTQGNKANGTCGGSGKDEVFSLEAEAGGQYMCEITDAGSMEADSVLYARRYCGSAEAAAEIVCNDDAAGDDLGSLSRIQFSLDEAETAYIFVDGFGRSDVIGTYTLTCSLEPTAVDDPAACVEEEVTAMGAGGAEEAATGGAEAAETGGTETAAIGGAEAAAPGGAEETALGGAEVAPGGAEEAAPGGTELAPGGAEVAPGGAEEAAPGGVEAAATGGTEAAATGGAEEAAPGGAETTATGGAEDGVSGGAEEVTAGVEQTDEGGVEEATAGADDAPSGGSGGNQN